MGNPVDPDASNVHDSTWSRSQLLPYEMPSTPSSIRSEGASEDEIIDVSQKAALAGLDSTCEYCVNIWDCLNHFTSQWRFHLGSFEDLLLAECPGHTPLIRAFQKSFVQQDTGDDTIWARYEEVTRTIYLSDEERPRSQWNIAVEDPGVFIPGRPEQWVSHKFNIAIAKDPSIPGHAGVGRVLSPEWVDLGAAREWKQECISEHGDACNDSMGVTPQRPAWLIDVRENCIVPGRDCPSFVALSYVWGKHSWLRVDADTLALLQQPGALVDIPEIATNLAPIVPHAMHLTSVLEERYLWIDAICIVQGAGDFQDQLNLTGSFYASAVVTIISADGDSQTGLPGLEGVSEPRQLIQNIIPFGNEQLVVHNMYADQRGIETSEYDRRGWTYQEYELSKRRLIFQDKRLRWECQHHIKVEDLVHAPWKPCEFQTSLKIAQAFPPGHLQRLEHTMLRYNTRKFSREEDALPGISGLLSIWSRTYKGGFLCGLPQMFFDRSLGWMPNRSYTNLRRRTSSGEDHASLAKNESMGILPSWSWIGWEGEVKLSALDCGPEAVLFNIYMMEFEETIPTTTWYTSNEAHGRSLRQITPSWYENRDSFYKDILRPLPEGWSRREFLEGCRNSAEENVPFFGPRGGLECTFRHKKHPGFPSFYPFPVVDFENTPQVMPKQTQYLFCKTQRTRLFACAALDETDGSMKNKTLLLHLGPHGDKIGELQAHNDELVKGFCSTEQVGLDTPERDLQIGAYMELVVIYESCKTEAQKNTEDDYWRRPFTGNLITHHKYTVLWIGWQEGVAYRKGVGHVDKASWELSGPEEIDLVLR